MRAPSSLVEHLVDIQGVAGSIPAVPTIGSLSEMDITEVYETSSPSSTLGETATSTHGETDITEVFETSGPGSTPGGCSNYFFLRDLRRRRGAGTNFLGFWRMRK